ncbi:MAG: pantoate--beta-alanine ligase, partial [Gemmatimonadetes bacterium]|nr:pantoate--beta-alanine ligase [Gemmatimonadota bacterium]
LRPEDTQSLDTRVLWCWDNDRDPAECAEQQRNAASRLPWDTNAPSVPSFTTDGNNASTAISEVNFRAPDTAINRPVSPTREYDYAWKNAWFEGSCNPLQFGPSEDLSRYPRDLERDLELARAAGADLVFTPAVAEMYPGGEPWVGVVPERGADVLCGASRPGHFRGVLTVVAKLFGIFLPDVAVFGQKDYQQLTLIRRMVADLDLPVEVQAGPVVREEDGLAMSSRNTYLTASERAAALALHEVLAHAEAAFTAGVRDPEAVRALLRAADGPKLALEYGEVVHPETLEPVTELTAGTVAAVAGRVGNTRLIDNTILRG